MKTTKMEKKMIENHLKKLKKDLNVWTLLLGLSSGIPLIGLILILSIDLLEFSGLFFASLAVFMLCFTTSFRGILSTYKQISTYKQLKNK